MAENAQSPSEVSKELAFVLKEVEKQVHANRDKFDDAEKTVKDFRRVFDQDSSRINAAIFNDASPGEIYQATLKTISVLVEILLRTKNK